MSLPRHSSSDRLIGMSSLASFSLDMDKDNRDSAFSSNRTTPAGSPRPVASPVVTFGRRLSRSLINTSAARSSRSLRNALIAGILLFCCSIILCTAISYKMSTKEQQAGVVLSLWNPLEVETPDCKVHMTASSVLGQSSYNTPKINLLPSSFSRLDREEKKLIAGHLQALVRGYQKLYAEHIDNHEYATQPLVLSGNNDMSLYVEDTIDDHSGKCPNHQPGLVKAIEPSNGSGKLDGRYCFGSANIKGERVCDVHIPNFDSSVEVHEDGVYSIVELYGKSFAYHPNYYLSTGSRAVLDENTDLNEVGIITISTQGTWNRVYNIVSLSRKWKGPISFAVMLDNRQQLADLDAMINEDEFLARHVDFHVVWRLDHHYTDHDAFYPINLLRNMALHPVKTTHVFVMDVDNIPNAPHLQYVQWIETAEKSEHIKRTDQEKACPGLHAFIPPAVEMNVESLTRLYEENKSEDTITKSQVIEGFFDGSVTPMHLYFGPAYVPTNHFDWASSDSVDEIPYLTRFEPYYIARMPIPIFNDTFVNRGGNFAQQVFEMSAGGYTLHRLPEAYIVDIPHTKVIKEPQAGKTAEDIAVEEETHGMEENMAKQARMDENFVAMMWVNFHSYVRHRYHRNMPTPQVSDNRFRTYRRSQEKVIEALWHMLGSQETPLNDKK